MSAARLGLGTVQFGSDYGITNKRGRVSEDEVGAILDTASAAGIGLLDTASAYGDSERVLGAALARRAGFRIVTKTPILRDAPLTRAHADMVRESLLRSLTNLRQDSLYGLLLHNPECLAQPGCEHIVDALQQLRGEGLVEKIGLSIYRGAEIDTALVLFRPDLVQLPINLLDQRLIRSGHVAKLKSEGVELHARSLFLQGLLLMPLAELPDWLAPIRPRLIALHRAIERIGISPLQACLAFAMSLAELDVLLVGVAATEELAEIVAAARGRPAAIREIAAFALDDERFVLPSNWPRHA